MPSSPCAAAAASARARSSSASDRRPRLAPRLLRALTGALTGVIALLTVAGCNGTGAAPTSAPSASSPAGSGAVEANGVVSKVVDGDTIDVTSGGVKTRIRMIGFNTPESVDPRRPVECFGKEASKHMASLAPVGTPVRLERDAEAKDRYGRTLAYVYRASDGLFLNLQMVVDGYAHVLSIPPNITFADRFLEAERTARAANIGLWSACPDSGS